MSKMLKISTTERNGELLQHVGYQHSRDRFGCKATCSTLGNTLTRVTKVTHDLALHDAKRNILKYISDAP